MNQVNAEWTGGLDDTAYDDCPELALAALMTMMSAFPGRQSGAIAESVIAHLYRISAEPRHPLALRECAADLIGIWLNYHRLAALPAQGARPQ